jgi:Leucine-rich repeat (LRR) protein
MVDADVKPQQSNRSRWPVVVLFLALTAIGIIAISFRPDDLGLSRNVREAVSEQLGKDVSALTKGDLERVTSLVLRYSEYPYLRLPAALSRWQHLIPNRKLIVTDDALEGMEHLPGLQSLGLDETQVTDAGLVHLEKLSKLRVLSLGRTQVTDAGLAHLAKLPALQSLNLSGTLVTDAGLVHLVKLPALQELYLIETPVTDAGLVQLKDERRKAGLWWRSFFR